MSSLFINIYIFINIFFVRYHNIKITLLTLLSNFSAPFCINPINIPGNDNYVTILDDTRDLFLLNYPIYYEKIIFFKINQIIINYTLKKLSYRAKISSVKVILTRIIA